MNAVALLMPLTATGTDELVVTDGLPSCPKALSPQHRMLPSPISAQAWLYPPASDTAFVRPLTAAPGPPVNISKVPSPRCPFSPSAQHFAVPSASSAQLNSSPAAARAAVERPLTA